MECWVKCWTKKCVSAEQSVEQSIKSSILEILQERYIKDIMKDIMKDIIIQEALPEDAEARIAYARQVGSETDNLSFGKEGFPISIEEEQEEIRL